MFAKTTTEGFKGNFQLLSLLDIHSTPTQITDFYNSGKPLNPKKEYGVNSKLFLNPDNSGSTAQFTITDAINSVNFTSFNSEDSDKVTETMYSLAAFGIGFMQIGSTFIIS